MGSLPTYVSLKVSDHDKKKSYFLLATLENEISTFDLPF